MKLLAFSDTHGHPQRMLDAVAQEPDAAACFFLGDGEQAPAALREAFPALPVYTARGNCDLASLEPAEGLVPFGGVLFFYTHGHAYRVKEGLNALCLAARRHGADAALFGHTHMPSYALRGGVHLFNPGSIALSRCGGPTYGRILVENQVPAFEIVRLEKG